MLPAEQRVSLLLHAMRNHRGARAGYAQRLVARGGGYRAATLMSWPPERLARELVRLNAETPQDEIELLQLLYIEVEPQYQIAFLDAAGVKHENGVLPEDLEAPYASEEAVASAARSLVEKFGAAGEHYLRTIARYNAEAWPGINNTETTGTEE